MMIRFFIFSLVLISCSSQVQKNQDQSNSKSEVEKIKTPKEYAQDYCSCLKESDNSNNCDSILKEVQSVYGDQNKEAEQEFSIEMQNCL